MTTTTDEQQRRNHRKRRSQTSKRPNKCQTTGRNADSRQQSSNNCDRRPETRNRYDALTDELIEGGITFHQPGTTDEETPINQRPTRTTDTTTTATTDFIGFHPKTNFSITFDLNSKAKDKTRLPTKFKLLS